MHRLRLPHPAQLPVCCFDLIYGPGLSENRILRIDAEKNTIRPALDKHKTVSGLSGRRSKAGSLRLIYISTFFHARFRKNRIVDGERHLRHVVRTRFSLKFPVHSRPFQHDILRSAGCALIQAPCPHDELHKIPDRNS